MVPEEMLKILAVILYTVSGFDSENTESNHLKISKGNYVLYCTVELQGKKTILCCKMIQITFYLE